MQISGLWQIFVVGALGGLFIELLRWWKIRESASFPEYAGSPLYWFLTLAMVFAGGILSVLYGTDSRSALMVANIGATAPAIIGAFAAEHKKDKRRTRSGGDALEPAGTLRSFLSFTG